MEFGKLLWLSVAWVAKIEQIPEATPHQIKRYARRTSHNSFCVVASTAEHSLMGLWQSDRFQNQPEPEHFVFFELSNQQKHLSVFQINICRNVEIRTTSNVLESHFKCAWCDVLCPQTCETCLAAAYTEMLTLQIHSFHHCLSILHIPLFPAALSSSPGLLPSSFSPIFDSVSEL